MRLRDNKEFHRATTESNSIAGSNQDAIQPDLDSSTEEKQIIEANKVNEDNDKKYEIDIDEIEGQSDDDSDSDEAPEGISLKQSKKDAQAVLDKQTKAKLLVKQKKKILRKEREERNKLQQEQKLKSMKQSLVPEKLDSQILNLVDKEIDVSELIMTVGDHKQNKKITFPDDENAADDNSSEEDEEIVENRIEAHCIRNINKPTNKSVNDFLESHFYGDRIKREDYKSNDVNRKRKQHKCNVGWLKKRNTHS